MVYPAIITLLTLFLYLALIFVVGKARGTFNIPAPAVTGNIEFERRLRVQQNMIEQMVMFLPALWLFATMLERPGIAAVIGTVWLVGRVLYSVAYIADAKKRTPGFIIAQIATVVLMLGALWGVIVRLTVS